MKRIIPFAALVCLSVHSLAQVYTQRKTRHRFAQLTLGADYRFLSGSNTRSAESLNNGIREIQLENGHESRLIIGGTHLWGHADFYVAFPVSTWGKSSFLSGVETGFKLYPWRIENHKIRPYAGLALSASSFKQSNGTSLERTVYPLQAGLTYAHRNILLDAGFAYNLKNQATYYLNRTDFISLHTHVLWFSAGVKVMLETTVGSEKYWENGSTQKQTETLAAAGKLNSFSLALGPSSAWFTRNSGYNQTTKPYLDQHKVSGVFPEFGLGYYFHKPDLHVNLAYRSITDEISAYGLEQHTNRRALTLETYKFLGVYHGFVPFFGLAVSYEQLKVTETESATVITDAAFSGVKPGITFGWDIRPNRLQAILLRTNLRYFPNLDVKMPGGGTVSFDQLEFNFIQVVVYPQRFRF